MGEIPLFGVSRRSLLSIVEAGTRAARQLDERDVAIRELEEWLKDRGELRQDLAGLRKVLSEQSARMRALTARVADSQARQETLEQSTKPPIMICSGAQTTSTPRYTICAPAWQPCKPRQRRTCATISKSSAACRKPFDRPCRAARRSSLRVAATMHCSACTAAKPGTFRAHRTAHGRLESPRAP